MWRHKKIEYILFYVDPFTDQMTTIYWKNNIYKEGLVTGVVFVDLSAAYDTVNHWCLLNKLLELTKDIHLTELIEFWLGRILLCACIGHAKKKNLLPCNFLTAMVAS